MDSRFQNSKEPSWQKSVRNQALHGVEIQTIQPTTSSAEVYEYDLPTTGLIMFGPATGFVVRCVIEVQDAATAKWSTASQAESLKMALQPNWFEHLIKDVAVFQNNTNLNCHDVPRSADPFINTYIYAHMHPEIKRYIFPEPQNPGNCVPVDLNDWALHADSKWDVYSKHVLGQSKLMFRYIPSFTFPFYQQPNFSVDGRPPAVIPMALVGKMTVSVYFREGMNNIFIRKEGNDLKYRVRIESMDLSVEEARCKPSFEKQFLNSRKMFYYDGLTRMCLAENIAATDLSHRCKFQGVAIPEGIFVCALPKRAVNGTYKSGLPKATVFEKHNIESLVVRYGNFPLAIKYPKYGDMRHHIMEIKSFIEHSETPPFGVLQDPKVIKYTSVYECGDMSVYPHVYMNLCPSGKETRIIPIGDDGHQTSQLQDLEIDIKFNEGGATADVTYMVYIFYSDVNMVFDMSNRQFFQYYNRLRKH